jgi:hypothetical protein
VVLIVAGVVYDCLVTLDVFDGLVMVVQGGSNMTGTVNKLQFVPVIFEPLCIND